GIDTQAHMVEIVRIAGRSRAALAAQRTVHGNQVDQVAAGAQLDQADAVVATLEATTQHVAIEVQHGLERAYAQDHMVDFTDPDHGSDRTPVLMRRAAPPDATVGKRMR